jgi:HEAT repeat protein
MSRHFVLAGYVLFLTLSATSAEDISSLLSRFQSEQTVAAKEAIILEISQNHPDAAPQLLKIARSTTDIDTKWLAIRGLGYLRYQPAAQFLVSSLRSPHHYVRANAARALGEMKAYSAREELISLLKTEQDNGVLEQTTLALEMIKAAEAAPVLKARTDIVSNPQARCWFIGGIAVLGSRADVSFIAKHLYEGDQVVAMCAASGLQQLTGEDLHLGVHPGPNDPSEAISKAKAWWEVNASHW